MIELISTQRKNSCLFAREISCIASSAAALTLLAFFLLPAVAVGNCLDALRTTSRDAKFDRDHDLDSNGNSFSCDAYVRASEALAVLEDFRYGFLYDSLPHVRRSIHFPLKVTIEESDGKDKVVMLKDLNDWLSFKAEHVDKYYKALIACATLNNVTIFRKWSGFSIGSGRIWFLNSSNTGLRMSQINVAPLSESQFISSCVVGKK